MVKFFGIISNKIHSLESKSVVLNLYHEHKSMRKLIEATHKCVIFDLGCIHKLIYTANECYSETYILADL